MGGEDHTGNFWDTPHAKTQFPNNLEGQEKAQIKEEVGGVERRGGGGKEGGEEEKSDGFARGVSIFDGNGDFESGWIELTGELSRGEEKGNRKKGPCKKRAS